jgi:hypothetical protein
MHRQLLGTAVHAPHELLGGRSPRGTVSSCPAPLGRRRVLRGKGAPGSWREDLRRSLACRFAGGCRAARAASAEIAVPKPHSVLAGPLRDSKIGVPADAAPGTIVSSNPDIPAGEGRWVT